MSSDSEDDCYGNIAQRLQKMKNKYTDDKIETTNLLDESSEIDNIVRLSTKSVSKTSSVAPQDISEPAVSDLPDELPESKHELSPKTKSKRVTRSAKNNSTDAFTAKPLPRAKRQKKDSSAKGKPGTATSKEKATANDTNSSTERSEIQVNASTSRGTMGGRGPSSGKGPRGGRTTRSGRWPNGGRGRNRSRHSLNNLLGFFDYIPTSVSPGSNGVPIPTYSVGNTDEYYDQSAIQPLFSNTTEKKTVDVMVVEEDNEDNEELSVKVYWQSSEFFKFMIRKYQKLKQIFDYFSHKENVSFDKLLFTFNDKILKPDDTLDSIGYTIVKFIDGGIVNQSVTHLTVDEVIKDGIKIKFQCQNVKRPLEITVRAEEKFSRAMLKCAKHLEKPLDKLRFEFDGDLISDITTPRELDLEGGECIDVKILH